MNKHPTQEKAGWYLVIVKSCAEVYTHFGAFHQTVLRQAASHSQTTPRHPQFILAPKKWGGRWQATGKIQPVDLKVDTLGTNTILCHYLIGVQEMYLSCLSSWWFQVGGKIKNI